MSLPPEESHPEHVPIKSPDVMQPVGISATQGHLVTWFLLFPQERLQGFAAHSPTCTLTQHAFTRVLAMCKEGPVLSGNTNGLQELEDVWGKCLYRSNYQNGA